VVEEEGASAFAVGGREEELRVERGKECARRWFEVRRERTGVVGCVL
jgi:hypothetical protein